MASNPAWQAFEVEYDGFTLAGVTLEPSDFCGNGLKLNKIGKIAQYVLPVIRN
jgi:hypothetical protein